jgi:hypothetical protein
MAEDAKKEEKAAEPKKEKVKEVTVVVVKSTKAKQTAAIDPRTGTRFEPNSARQLAFNVITKAIKEGKKVKEIREILAATRKDSGSPYNLDAAYLNFVIASHPEMFQVKSDGVVTIVKEPVPDPEAAKKFEEEKEKRRKKAEEARDARRKEKAEKKEGEADKKEKSDKSEKKAEPDKKVKKEEKK